VSKIVNRDSEHIRRLCNQLLNKIISVTSFRPNGTSTMSFKPLASWFFKDCEITEEEFVLALSHLREHHPDYYYKIDIPRKWDGGAHLEFPELFMDGEVVMIKATRAIPLMLLENGDELGPYSDGDICTVSTKVASMLIRRRMATKCDAEN